MIVANMRRAHKLADQNDDDRRCLVFCRVGEDHADDNGECERAWHTA